MGMEVVIAAGVIIFSVLLVMQAVYDRVVFWVMGVYSKWKYPRSLTLGDYISLDDVEL